MSIKTKLYNLSANYNIIITWKTLSEWAMLIGCKPATAERKARDLATEGKWERLEGKYANYIYNSNLKPTENIYETARKIREDKETNYQLNT